MRSLLLAFISVFSISCFSQQASTAAAETPAVRVFHAWLAAFNADDPAKIRAFDATHQPATPLEKMGRFRQMSGGFTLVRIEKSDATSVSGLVKEMDSDGVARFEFTVSTDDPPKLLANRLNLIPPPPDLVPARITEAALQTALKARQDRAAEADRFSGTVLIARDGKPLFEQSWGRADREGNAPITRDTQFRLGSMNKMFTAVAILQMADAGKLSLDDTVGKHLTGYPNADVAGKVTIRHLLSHTGGTGDIFGPEYEKNRLTLRTHNDYLKLYGERAPGHEPGAQFRYSNYGFVLLGLIIEKISGVPYYDFVQKSIFAPAGMTSTASLPETEPVPNRSRGYMLREGKWLPNTDTLPWRGTAAGGGYSTAGDLLRFATALQSGKLLSPAMLAEATRVQKQNYGFGMIIEGEGAWKSFGHGGGAPGMSTELRIIPEKGYVVIVLSNLDPPAAGKVTRFITARLP